jgi:predicted  nucleic acid-binding Zn-ribbon protein
VPDLHRLLDLQDRDVTLDQLLHRREALPERAELSTREAALAALEAELSTVQSQLHDIEVAQKRLEDEIATIDAKSETETRKLNSGTVTAPREIQALSDEVDALARRKRSLEDDELELMEAGEPLTATVDRLSGERATIVAEVDRLRGAIAEQETSIDAEVSSVRTDREGIAGELPADLLSQYEKLRSKLGGVAVARLQGDLCTGCHVSLPAVEVDAIRHSPADAIVTHEECGRILVR